MAGQNPAVTIFKDNDMKLKELHGARISSIGKTRVWQTDQHQGQKTSHWYNGKTAKGQAPTYRWPRTTFHGQSEGHAEHTLS